MRGLLSVALKSALAIGLECYAIHALVAGHTTFSSARYDLMETVGPNIHPFLFWVNVLGAGIFGGLCFLSVWLDLKKWRQSASADGSE